MWEVKTWRAHNRNIWKMGGIQNYKVLVNSRWRRIRITWDTRWIILNLSLVWIIRAMIVVMVRRKGAKKERMVYFQDLTQAGPVTVGDSRRRVSWIKWTAAVTEKLLLSALLNFKWDKIRITSSFWTRSWTFSRRKSRERTTKRKRPFTSISK